MKAPGLLDLRIHGLRVLNLNTREPMNVRAANAGEPIRVDFDIYHTTTIVDARMIGRAIKDYTRSIERLVIFYNVLEPNVPNAEERLQITTSFASEMEGANTTIHRLHVFAGGAGGADVEDAIVQSNAELASLKPLLESNSTINELVLFDSNANANGIRAFLNFFTSGLRFKSLKHIFFNHCPNFGDDAAQSFVRLTQETNHVWASVGLKSLPFGNIGIRALIDGLKTKNFYFDEINIDDIGAEFISMALLSASTRKLLGLTIHNCPSMTTRGSNMILRSVYNDTSLQSVTQCNHTLRRLKITVEEEVTVNFVLGEFSNRLNLNDDDPRVEMVKSVVYLKDNFKPSELEGMPLELLPMLLKKLDRLGELDLLFRIIQSRDPKVWISTCTSN